MRLFLPLLAKRMTRAKMAYTDRIFDRSSEKVARRASYVLRPLPFADDVQNDLPSFKELEDVEEEMMKKTNEKMEIPFNVTEDNKFEIINRVMCPLHVVQYENQLKIKYNQMKRLLGFFGKKVKMQGSNQIALDSSNLPCPLEFTRRSPRITEYRNKDEFSIWPGVDGNRKTVGFFVGEPSKHTNVVCVEPEKLMISKKSHRALAKKFQDYLRNVTPLDVCTNFSEGGYWRRFVVRSNEEGEHMIITQMHPQELQEEQIQEEMERVKNYFSEFAEESKIISAYFQTLKTCRSPAEKDPYLHLFGEKTLTESILGHRFQISPEAFFQINTLGAEQLYTTILEELNPTKDLTVIDLCSGTGTMAVLVAPKVRRVIAIEQSQQAIGDGKNNARENGIRNITFIKGMVEDILPQLGDQLFGQRVAIICNPGRGGLRHSCISAIRQMSNVEKVVYISCKPDGMAMKNFVHLTLMGGKFGDGSALVPVHAVPVDLFPQTDHTELVLTFERFDF